MCRTERYHQQVRIVSVDRLGMSPVTADRTIEYGGHSFRFPPTRFFNEAHTIRLK